MCEGSSSNDFVFDQTILHRVWGSSLDCSDRWYDIIRSNKICQQNRPCFNVPVSISREIFCPFDYRKSLHDIGDFGLIPLFIFIEGPVPDLCENIVPYSNKGLTIVRMTHGSLKITHIAPTFRFLQQL